VIAHYPEDPDRARELAQTALKSMAERGIPANPNNFSVWYSYHAGSYGELVKGLDALLGSGAAFTPSRNDEIFEKYFGSEPDSQRIHETSGQIESALGSVMERLGDAGESAADYGQKLADFTGEMGEQTGAEEVRELSQRIMGETRHIIEKNQELERSLGDSAKQINTLRENLEEARQEAMTDALTGISNRKYFELRLAEETAAHRESREPLSLLMLDIDHFKKFNDTFGHRIGDEVLKVVGRVLKSSVKGRDAPVRYGGEEFAVILPQTDLEDAATVGDQLRANLASRQLKSKKTGESYGTITISVGAAQYRVGEPAGEWLQRADDALYQAKRDGRNRVVAEAAEYAAVQAAG